MDEFSVFLVKYLRMRQLDCRFSMFILKQQQQKPAKLFSKPVVPSSFSPTMYNGVTFPNLPQYLGLSLLSSIDSSCQTWHPIVVFNLYSILANEWESFHILIYHLKFSTHLENCVVVVVVVIDLQAFIIYPKYKPFIRYIKKIFCIFTIQSVKKIGLYAS